MPDVAAGVAPRQPATRAEPAPLRWRAWFDAERRPGWANMALDRAMLDLATGETALLRLYGWAPHCLSFGCHEPAARRYDRARIAELGLDVVRRPTGGRAVWHARELTYAVAAPTQAFGDLRAAYRLIHLMLRDAVRALGAPATLAPAHLRTGRLDAGACFASPVGGEVLVAGAKLCGSAQVRRGEFLLQHGSLLLAGTQDIIGQVALGPLAPAASTTLEEALGRPVPMAAAADAVLGACHGWPGAWHRLRGTPDDLMAGAATHEAQFRSAEWTWRR